MRFIELEVAEYIYRDNCDTYKMIVNVSHIIWIKPASKGAYFQIVNGPSEGFKTIESFESLKVLLHSNGRSRL